MTVYSEYHMQYFSLNHTKLAALQGFQKQQKEQATEQNT